MWIERYTVFTQATDKVAFFSQKCNIETLEQPSRNMNQNKSFAKTKSNAGRLFSNYLFDFRKRQMLRSVQVNQIAPRRKWNKYENYYYFIYMGLSCFFLLLFIEMFN